MLEKPRPNSFTICAPCVPCKLGMSPTTLPSASTTMMCVPREMNRRDARRDRRRGNPNHLHRRASTFSASDSPSPEALGLLQVLQSQRRKRETDEPNLSFASFHPPFLDLRFLPSPLCDGSLTFRRRSIGVQLPVFSNSGSYPRGVPLISISFQTSELFFSGIDASRALIQGVTISSAMREFRPLLRSSRVSAVGIHPRPLCRSPPDCISM